MLVQAFATLANRYPDWNVEFWGEKSSHYARSMEEEIKAKHLGDRILLKGKTNHIEEVYYRSDIFAFPVPVKDFHRDWRKPCRQDFLVSGSRPAVVPMS